MADDAANQASDSRGTEQAAALTLDEISHSAGPNPRDDDEWEYEYSSTETETYYLTVELSYPEFRERLAKAHHHSRGGYYKNWLDQNIDHTDTLKKTLKPTARPGADDDNEDGASPVPAADTDDDMPDLDPRLTGKQEGTKKTGPENIGAAEGDAAGRTDTAHNQDAPERKQADEPFADGDGGVRDIQVLDLHSRNPVISYRGRVYEGQWAEVIGTEAILASRDDDDDEQLPALRNLPDGVDLLAFSASRILTSERALKPKVPEEDTLEPIRQEWNIKIPTGKFKSQERAQQARFLENLIALKKKKGEKDQVTVYARDPEGKDFEDNVDPDHQVRRRKAKTTERRPRRTGRPKGRPRGWRREQGTLAAGLGTERAEGADTSLSTPTPSRWADLAQSRNEAHTLVEDEDDDEDDDDDENSDDLEDEEMEDTGAQDDEDEDVTMASVQ